MARAALALAALADSITFVLMPLANEANPIVRAEPLLALALKGGLALVLLAWPYRYALPLRLIAASAWTVGALSNAIVLGGL